MTLNWDQFNSFPYNQPFLNAIDPRTNLGEGYRLRSGVPNDGILSPRTIRTNNGTLPNMAALYPSHRNPVLPPMTNLGLRVPLYRPQILRSSNEAGLSRNGDYSQIGQTALGGYPVRDTANYGLNTPLRGTGSSARHPMPNGHSRAPGTTNKLTIGNNRNVIFRPAHRARSSVNNDQRKPEQSGRQDRQTPTSVNGNAAKLDAFERPGRRDVSRNSERAFVQPPRVASVPPSLRKPDGIPQIPGRLGSSGSTSGERPLLSSNEQPDVGELAKSGSRGYVLGDRRRSYLDYYKDHRRTEQAIEQLNRGSRVLEVPYYDHYRNSQRTVDTVMALESGIAVDDSPVGADRRDAAYDLPDLDKNIERTLEITPEGERVVLYDLTDVFKDDDLGQGQDEQLDGINNLGLFDSYADERDDGDDDDDDDDDDDRDPDQSEDVYKKGKESGINPDKITDRRLDERIFDYINKIMKNVKKHNRRHSNSRVVDSVTMDTTAEALSNTLTSDVAMSDPSKSITATGPSISDMSTNMSTPEPSQPEPSTVITDTELSVLDLSTKGTTTEPLRTDLSTNSTVTEPLRTDLSTKATTVESPLTDLSTNGTTTEPSVSALSTNGTTTDPSFSALSTNGTTTEPSVSALSTNGTTKEPSVSALSTNGTTTEPSVSALSTNGTTIKPSVSALSTNCTNTERTSTTEAILFSVGSHRYKSFTCPKCVKSRDMINNFCNSDIVARVKTHSSRIIGNQTRYKVTFGEFYRQTVLPSDGHFVWVNNTCRCPRLRKNTDYLVMGASSNGRFTINSKSYARKFKTSMKKKLSRLTDYCPV
ncbi:hypothetical protein LSH36_184g08017 [Paralvinella palmiformis]|uniref:NTR domain-containing protein n=1 Tax=Paralvinella palmiformis TaxID=53620 RepID=A0AAD9JTA2_9ANNE|nr:hypothetical protein LSH36_184g08017 [Paralvinella palmiformis]